MDEYIPFTISFENEKTSSLYWRGGDGRLSLVEIGLTECGIVNNIILTTINSNNVEIIKHPLSKDLLENRGLPVFYIDKWVLELENYSSKFYDNFNLNIRLILGNNFITLILCDVKKPVHYIINQKVRFGFSKDSELLTIDIVELTFDQIMHLQENIY